MKQRIFAVIQLANITKIMPFFTIFSPKTTQKNSSSHINKTTLLNSAHKNGIPSRLKEHPQKNDESEVIGPRFRQYSVN